MEGSEHVERFSCPDPCCARRSWSQDRPRLHGGVYYYLSPRCCVLSISFLPPPLGIWILSFLVFALVYFQVWKLGVWFPLSLSFAHALSVFFFIYFYFSPHFLPILFHHHPSIIIYGSYEEIIVQQAEHFLHRTYYSGCTYFCSYTYQNHKTKTQLPAKVPDDLPHEMRAIRVHGINNVTVWSILRTCTVQLLLQ